MDFSSGMESRSCIGGGVVGIIMLGVKRHITDCDKWRKGGFNGCCFCPSGSDREKRYRGTSMRYNLRG